MSEQPTRSHCFAGLLAWFARQEWSMLVVLLVLAGSLWAFAEVVDEVFFDGDDRAFDENVLLAMRSSSDRADPWGPEWVEEMARDFTALGGVGVQALLTLGVVGVMGFRRKWKLAILILVCVVGGMTVSTLLKYGFSRPRPDLVPYGSYVYTSSFPSGHSMMAAVTYLTLAAVLARAESRKRAKVFVIVLGVALTVCVGVSRVYLGVHWPTDVLAGWTVGAAWAALCWLVALRVK